MKRVVIDTNVLVRAFLKKGGSDGLVYDQFLEGKVELYYGRELVDEFMNVISRPRLKVKYDIQNGDVELFWEDIFEFGKMIIPKKTEACRDARDNHILGLAMKARGKGEEAYLITADEDLLVLKGKIKGIKIVTAKEFVRISA